MIVLVRVFWSMAPIPNSFACANVFLVKLAEMAESHCFVRLLCDWLSPTEVSYSHCQPYTVCSIWTGSIKPATNNKIAHDFWTWFMCGLCCNSSRVSQQRAVKAQRNWVYTLKHPHQIKYYTEIFFFLTEGLFSCFFII